MVMTGYRLTTKNDITKGGQVFPISLVRVGRMVKATKDLYKRVYRDNGTYHYPKIAANKLQTKGVEYSQAVEITGSKEGTNKDPKLSLISVHCDTIIPDMDKLAEQLNENGTKKIIFVRQDDGAGPHTDKTYNKFMFDEFQRRDWINFRQPSQSPVLNTCDACFFPMMSKAVTREQGLSFGGRMMRGEELYESVKKVWNDRRNLPALARSYAGHHQIVCAMLENNGRKNYLRERKELLLGVRKAFMKTEDDEGVMLVPEAMVEVEGAHQQILAERGMKTYPQIFDR